MMTGTSSAWGVPGPAPDCDWSVGWVADVEGRVVGVGLGWYWAKGLGGMVPGIGKP